VRVDLATADVATVEICGLPGGLVANPPVVDDRRRVVVGYDSGNGVVAAFDLDTLAPRWRRDQDHASHLLLYADTGELVTGDNTDVVVLDISTGHELARTDSGGGVQSVLFPAPGFERDFYVCSFLTVTRVTVTA
jgi:outer membrane protein assembly factor BamB